MLYQQLLGTEQLRRIFPFPAPANVTLLIINCNTYAYSPLSRPLNTLHILGAFYWQKTQLHITVPKKCNLHKLQKQTCTTWYAYVASRQCANSKNQAMYMFLTVLTSKESHIERNRTIQFRQGLNLPWQVYQVRKVRIQDLWIFEQVRFFDLWWSRKVLNITLIEPQSYGTCVLVSWAMIVGTPVNTVTCLWIHLFLKMPFIW